MYILLTLFYSFWAFNAKNGLQVGKSNGSDGEINWGSMYLNYILLFGFVLGKVWWQTWLESCPTDQSTGLCHWKYKVKSYDFASLFTQEFG